MKWLKKLFGTKHQRDIKRLKPLVDEINRIEKEYQSLPDQQLREKTEEFRERIRKQMEQGLAKRLEELRQSLAAAIDERERAQVKAKIRAAYNSVLDPLLPEAYAAVKNACRRLVGTRYEVCGHEVSWDMVPFDVQLMGAIVLHQGKIAEMATGEGKTLVATMPLYLNALTGRNVHLVTVNDYLARRDAQWMGLVYQFLGVTVGCIQNHMDAMQRRAEYAKDITYGTNSEFGFDYLRDNGMAYDPESVVQRGHYYAIIDEVDSILIDEARTPLIISGPASVSSHRYYELKPKVEELVRRQRMLCNRLAQEIRELLDKGKKEEAQLKLYQLYHGMPKHKQLMHMLEDPAIRRLHEQIESAMLTDMRKDQARELREELFFTIDERGHDATLTEKGCQTLNPADPDMYVLPDLVTAMAEIDADRSLSEEEKAQRRIAIQEDFMERSERIHNVDQLIRAYCLYERDVDYVVQNNQVLIVDEFTGRILPGRRWSDGLHQAVEAKEGVQIEGETQTLATITIQNYFRMYERLAGMTGTAETEADEFASIYNLDVVVIPTNRPVRRLDKNDLVYKTQREKYKAIIDEIVECHQRGQPVLVGTASVETSEVLSRMLKRAGIPHNVLNAKNHEREAEIVARAGQVGAVTIATNMAGRGTDIKLGEGVVHLDRKIIESQLTLDDRLNGKTVREILKENPCGLHVVGSERHEARRIDRQLRGRCARQGDPGSSRFYVSLEDDLMRLFGSDRIANIMTRLGLEEGQPLEHPWLNRSIETAQKRVEQQNFAIRKRTLEYDDVMNKQREVIYGFRGEIVRSPSVREQLYAIIEDVIFEQAAVLLKGGGEEGLRTFVGWLRSTFPVALDIEELKAKLADPEAVAELIVQRVRAAYEFKVSLEDQQVLPIMERHIILQVIDSHWQDYLRGMELLRQGVGLRAYGQQDPLIEYKREAYSMFEQLMGAIKQDIASSVFRFTTVRKPVEPQRQAAPRRFVHSQVSALGQRMEGRGPAPQPSAQGRVTASAEEEILEEAASVVRRGPKVGRNDPCPCGSGKKYKKCCGR
ncbi:MAG: preprotein translocase subunit SecA [Kiritimatiellia bacterium]